MGGVDPEVDMLGQSSLPDSKTEILDSLFGRACLSLNHRTTGVGEPMAWQDNTNVTPVVTCVSSRGRTSICGCTPNNNTTQSDPIKYISDNHNIFIVKYWTCSYYCTVKLSIVTSLSFIGMPLND